MKKERTFAESRQIFNDLLMKNRDKIHLVQNNPCLRCQNPRRIVQKQQGKQNKIPSKRSISHQKRTLSNHSKTKIEQRMEEKSKKIEKKNFQPPLPVRKKSLAKKSDKKVSQPQKKMKKFPKLPPQMVKTIMNIEKRDPEDAILIKMALIGDQKIGKTSMIISYTKNLFPEEYKPTVFDHYRANISCSGQKIQLYIWDTSGKQEFVELREISCKQADIILICFSLIDEDSFQNAKSIWLSEAELFNPNAIKIFVGNMSDLHKQYELDEKNTHKIPSLEEFQMWCQKNGYKFSPCSALTQKNLNETLTLGINQMLQKMKKKNKKENCVLI